MDHYNKMLDRKKRLKKGITNMKAKTVTNQIEETKKMMKKTKKKI